MDEAKSPFNIEKGVLKILRRGVGLTFCVCSRVPLIPCFS